MAALEPEYVVVGGGNIKKLPELPPGCCAGDNTNAFLGDLACGRKRACPISPIPERLVFVPKTQPKKSPACLSARMHDGDHEHWGQASSRDRYSRWRGTTAAAVRSGHQRRGATETGCQCDWKTVHARPSIPRKIG